MTKLTHLPLVVRDHSHSIKPETLYTVEQIAEWREQAEQAELDGRHILDKYSDEELAVIFNGIGSDGFPEWLRIALSKLHPSLMAAALINDVQWYERALITKPIAEIIDRENFHESNDMLNRNATKMAKFNYAWYSPVRYIVECIGWNFKRLCNKNLGFHWWKSPNPITT